MYNLFSYFYPASTTEETTEIKPQLEEVPKIKHSHVDAHLLVWDLHHLSYHELEDKYRAKYLTLCTLLKAEGYPIFHISDGNRTDIESKLITVPQELTFARHHSL